MRPFSTFSRAATDFEPHSWLGEAGPTLALFAVTPDTEEGTTLPALSTAILHGDALHKCLVSRHGQRQPTGVFTGLTGSGPARGHRHAHCLSLALQPRGACTKTPSARIDHLAVWAPMGFDADARDTLLRVRRTHARGIAALHLVCTGLGTEADFDAVLPHVGAAQVWVSDTPYVAPRFQKKRGRNSLRGQLVAALVERDFPEPASIAVEVEDSGGAARWVDVDQALVAGTRTAPWWRHFKLMRPARKGRSDRHLRPPTRLARGVRLTFAEPVRGPIALGFGAHFGLGLFRPEA